jgi:HK97 family phage major capsid protein
MASLYASLVQEQADLTKEQGELRTEAARLGAAALARNPAAMTAEEQARDDAIFARLEAIGERFETLSPQLERENQRRAWERSVPAVADVSAMHDRVADAPWGHELGVRLIQQADGTRRFGGIERAGEAALGACMQAIFRAGMGGPMDPRFIQAAALGGNTSDPAAGGFSVGTDMSMFLFQMGAEAAVLLPRCNSIPVSADSDGIEAPYVTNTSRATGSRFGGVRVYRRKEAATVASSFPEEEKFELRLADLMGLAYQTDRLLSDARAMGAIYATAFRNEFAFVIDDELVRGDGVGQCQGVLLSPCLVSVAKEVGQAAATVVLENLIKMWIRLPVRSKSNAVWFINQELGPQLDQLYISAGISALEPRFINYGPDGILRIKGRPVVEIEQASALGTQGDIMLLDLGEMVVITKGALEQAESDHVRFIYGERTFRWTQRINAKCPWRTAVTPYKGTATLSPFVTLDTRA